MLESRYNMKKGQRSMLNRKYIVPSIVASEELEVKDVEGCIERLNGIKNSIEEEKTKEGLALEAELDALFMSIGGEKIVSEMERVVVLLCKIAHKIIRAEEKTEEDQGILLQIFELGLFMVQFRDRWLDRVSKSGLLKEHELVPCVEYSSVDRVFPPSRELVSLAQEYTLRKKSLDNVRCDLCAFALANSLGVYHPSSSLLLRQPESHKKELSPFFFLGYVFAEAEETKKALLVDWLAKTDLEFDGTIFYLPGISVLDFISIEASKIKDKETLQKIIRVGKSHRVIYHAREPVFALHKKGKLTTKELSELLSETYHPDETEYTEKIIKDMAKFSPVGAEFILKSLIIFQKAEPLAKFFFQVAFIIDKEYAESVIICRESLGHISKDRLNDLCASEYFALLCREIEVFKRLVKCIAEIYEDTTEKSTEQAVIIKHGWNLERFIQSVFAVLPTDKDAIERALILTVYFPWLTMHIKQVLWQTINQKHLQFRLSKKTANLEEEIEMLNHFREIPQVRQVIIRAFKIDQAKTESHLFSKDLDVFLINHINKEIQKGRTNLPALKAILTQFTSHPDFNQASYWHNIIKKQIVLGKDIITLNELIPTEDLASLVSQEEDIATLLKLLVKTPLKSNLFLTLLEKLELQTKYEQGLVFTTGSFLAIDLIAKKLCIYANLIQKEFSGKQSLIKLYSSQATIEIYLNNGKIKIATTTINGNDKEERIISIEEDLEKNPLNGWKVPLALAITNSSFTLKIGEIEYTQKHKIKRIQRLVIGEDFRGILKRLIILEEAALKPDRLSLKHSEAYFLDHLMTIEQSMQYYKRFALLIESPTPYHMSGPEPSITMCNLIYHQPIFWRSSESLTRFLAKSAAKNTRIEKLLLSFIQPTTSQPTLPPITDRTSLIMP
ncbi:hypothetical protein NEHOM01_2141 [Nematocida homosporus]|uniref:uncharacterized protein n=1 Tax=Nematocida homosporus TaxID=1912981 RepID=UPI00221F26E7|nr:uncharacterized protein NEHOM01_2141 [Nematocida homosporus]KAI5187391.1 hypothetical protein NEHOM01_2141 [Nematocida homosporus]